MTSDPPSMSTLQTMTPPLLDHVVRTSFLGDISPDGERFLILTPTGENPPSTELHVTLNWFDELKRLVLASD